MKVPKEQQGICSTCNHLDGCSYRSRWKGPVMHCEEFDDWVPSVARVVSPRETEVAASNLGDKEDVSVGLCVNCEHRLTCTFPKPDGGVWHCEEWE